MPTPEVPAIKRQCGTQHPSLVLPDIPKNNRYHGQRHAVKCCLYTCPSPKESKKCRDKKPCGQEGKGDKENIHNIRIEPGKQKTDPPYEKGADCPQTYNGPVLCLRIDISLINIPCHIG